MNFSIEPIFYGIITIPISLFCMFYYFAKSIDEEIKFRQKYLSELEEENINAG